MSNTIRQSESVPAYLWWMNEVKTIDSTRRGFGMRLAAAREAKSFTQDDIARRFSINKGTVSAWETGRGDPGVYRLRELAKLYGLSADALLWEDSLTPEAMQVAVEFDGLNEQQKRTFHAMMLAYVRSSATDLEVEKAMPITKTKKRVEPEADPDIYTGPERRLKH